MYNLYKNIPNNFIWVFGFCQVRCQDAKTQKHPLGWILLNHTEVDDEIGILEV